MSNRYARQILFYGIGEAGQKTLREKSAAIVGCGALGCTSANLLVRSGLGYLKIIDRDFIEESNLQRQSLFDEEDINKNLPKAIAAQKKLEKINPHVRIKAFVTDLNPSNINNTLRDADVIIDGTDNFETRFLLNDFCVKSDCVTCKQHHYEFLSKDRYSMTTALCGRNAVQILQREMTNIDFTKLAERLNKEGV